MLSPARMAAFGVLLRVEQQDAYASELLRASGLRRLSPADHALCTEIVMGVLRWRSRLDNAISRFSSQSLAKLDDEVLTALRMGAYQLGFLDRVPARAVVDDSVELVKRHRKSSAAPFVNAILRKLSSQKAIIAPPASPGGNNARDLAESYAHPLWLVERWITQRGISTVKRICAYDQQPPPTAIRLYTADTEQTLVQAGVRLAAGKLLGRARHVFAGAISATQAFAEGQVAIQDEASQLVALLVGSGERLLDCCAAPGGKTAILAERNPQSAIVASDFRPHRARLLRDRLRARSAAQVHVIAADARQLPLKGEFDRVLADVPCSGTGTLARHPEIKWRLQASDLADLQGRQKEILNAALDRLSPGGRTVYSTCSLEPEENGDVVNEVIAERPGYRAISCRHELVRLRESGELAWNDVDSLTEGPFLQTLPGVHPCDGFFAAIIARDY